jgi:hypothetical protein
MDPAAGLTGVLACSSGGSGRFSGVGDGLSSRGGSRSGSGGSSSGSGSDDASGTASGGGASSGSASGAGNTDAGSSGGRTTLFGDAAVPDAQLDQPITLVMSPFTVPANSEVYKCQGFGNPFGHDVDLTKMVGTMSAGSHHFFLFNMSQATGRNGVSDLADCPGAGLEFHSFPSGRRRQVTTRSSTARTWATRWSARMV